MKQDNVYTAIKHEQVNELLPWYVNDSLKGAELFAVEQHLKVCLVCRRDMLNLSALAHAVNEPGRFDTAANNSFARLKTRLNSQPVNQPVAIPQQSIIPVSAQNSGKLGRVYSGIYKTVLAIAACFAIALVVPQLNSLKPFFGDNYRTLSDARPGISGNPNEIKVIFKSGTPVEIISQVFDSLKANTVNGPDEKALFTVSFDQSLTKSALLEKLSQLKSNDNVVFAEPDSALFSKTTSVE